MVYLHTKNPKRSILWRALECKILVYVFYLVFIFNSSREWKVSDEMTVVMLITIILNILWLKFEPAFFAAPTWADYKIFNS
jgi:hypothetical protein